MVWKRPNMELRLSLKGDRNSIDVVDGSIKIYENGVEPKQKIRRLQTDILCNKIPESGVYTIAKHDGDPMAPIVSSYTFGRQQLDTIACGDRDSNFDKDRATQLRA